MEWLLMIIGFEGIHTTHEPYMDGLQMNLKEERKCLCEFCGGEHM